MYIISAPVPADLATAIEPYRQKYDPHAAVISPHITVIKPFIFSEPLSNLYDHLEEIGETHAPIKVSLVGWDIDAKSSFELKLPVMAGRQEFTALRENLLAGPLSHLRRENLTYWPHVPFGEFSIEAEMETAKSTLRGFEPQFIFRVTHLELQHRDDASQPWQLLKRFGLEATIASRRKKNQPAKVLRMSRK